MWAGFRQRLALFFRGNDGPAVAVFSCKAQRQPFDIAAGVAFLRLPNVSKYRQAAEVIDSVKPHLEMRFYLDKAKHLARLKRHRHRDWLNRRYSPNHHSPNH